MTTPKEDAQELLDSVLPLAKQMLNEYGEFYPYGGSMATDGKITHVGGKIEGTDRPKSKSLIDLLRQKFQEAAKNGQLKATAVIFDVRIKPPDSENKTDAIQACLDHREGYSVEVLFPYKIANGEVLFGRTFAQKGEGKIFAP